MNAQRTMVHGQKERSRRFGFGVWRPGRKFKRTTLQRPDLSVVVSAEPEQKIEKAPGLEQWQELVLMYADKVPIVSAAERYYIEATKQVRYFLADRNSGEGIQTSHPADRIIDILNSHNEEIARGVGLRFLIGETRFTFDPRTDEIDVYGAGEMYSKSGRLRIRTEEGKERDIDPALAVWRSHDPDRKFSNKATSSLKPLIDVMEAIVIAYAEERAVSIRQTMNAGMIVVHESVFSVGGDEDAVNSEGSSPGAALEAKFQAMLGMTIQNPRQAASFVPSVIIVGGEDADVSKKIVHVGMAADRDKRKISERLDMLKKEIAVGVDLPSDQAQGFLADMNHWNGRLVDENSYKNYVGPKIKSTAGDAFEEIAEWLNIGIDGVWVGIDSSELVSPEDRSDAAFKAFDLGFISEEAARKWTGFTEDDAPDPADVVEPSGDQAATEGAVDDGGDGVTAAAARDGKPNLRIFNKDLKKARYTFERELREAVMEIAAEFTDPEDGIQAAARKSPGGKNYPGGPLQAASDRITQIVKKGQKGISRAAARGLATVESREWYTRHEARLVAQAERAGADGAKLIEGYLTNRKVSAIPGRDSYGIARSIESVAAGGPPSMRYTGDPTQARPLAIMEDQDFIDMVAEDGSAAPVYTWEHGSPPKPFTPHEDLDGETWTQDTEDFVLQNDGDYPQSAIFHPGDHDGCTCRYDVDFERID